MFPREEDEKKIEALWVFPWQPTTSSGVLFMGILKQLQSGLTL